MKKSILVLGTTILLASCASGPSSYQLYADTQAKIAQANAIADTARYNALLEIAKNGDSAAKVAAVLSIQMGQGGAGSRPQQQVAAPEDWDTKLLKWAGVLLPSVTQIYGIHSQRQIAVTQSNNAAATAQSTNNTFATMSTNMANSNTNIAKAGFDAVGAANTAITTIANSSMTAVTNVANNGITGVTSTSKEGLSAATSISTAGIIGVNNAANAGLTATTNLGTTSINGLITATNNANTTITSLGTQASNNLTTVTGGYRSALDTAISKLSGTTTTTTTTTTNTTSTNNNVCTVGQVLINGICK